MNDVEFIKTICILIIIIAIPLFFYFLNKIINTSSTVKVRAQWEEIKKHISLDDLDQKTNQWKQKGYEVSELEMLIDQVRRQ